MRIEYFEPIWSSNDFYELPFDSVKLIIDEKMATMISGIQNYVHSNEAVEEVTVKFHSFELLQNRHQITTQVEPGTVPKADEFSIESAFLIINEFDYYFRMVVDENVPITIEAYA